MLAGIFFEEVNVMRAIEFGLAGVAAALIALAPADLQAQGRGKVNGRDDPRGGPPGLVKKPDDGRRLGPVMILDDDDRRERVDRRIRRDRDDAIILRDRDGRVIVIGRGGIDERFRANPGGGPSFCRTGAGHPVFGRRWCLEKGFGLGDRNDVFFDDGRVFFWDGDVPVIVRDRRIRSDRSLWEAIVDRVLFWSD